MDTSKTHSLGHRAFFLFLSRRIKSTLLLAALTIAIWYSERFFPDDYSAWVDYAAKIMLLATAGVFVLMLLITYIEYRRYTYRFTEEAFVVTHGYIVNNEIATVYHQIQSVNVKRTPMDRAVGVSQLIITLAGMEKESRQPHMVLPAMERRRAALVQKELLMRARKHANPHTSSEGDQEVS